MNINTIDDVISLLMRRDRINENEARNAIYECQMELNELMRGDTMNFGVYDEAANILADYLSLEPDYLDIILGY